LKSTRPILLQPTRLFLAFLLWLAVLLAAGPAVAQDQPGNIAMGKRFALNVCAECHFVTEDQEGLVRADAPTFDDVANMPSTTQLSLRVFLMSPHARRQMPNLVLSEQQMDDVIAYILSMRRE